MTNVLKILFSGYAVYAAFIAVQTALRHGTPRFWLWAGVSLCFLPVAWGLIREKKWAWNCAVGLVIFRCFWVAGQLAGLLLSNVVDKTSLLGIVARTFAVNTAVSICLLTLLMLARRGFPSAPVEADPDRKYSLRPVFVGVLFLLMGILALVHPSAQDPSPMLLRMVALGFMAFLWIGAALSFFECDTKMIRRWAKVATGIAVAGAISSLSFYAYFALFGLLVGTLQLLLGSAALFTVRRSVFVTPSVAAA